MHFRILHLCPPGLAAHLDQLGVVELLGGQGVHLLRTAGGDGQVHVRAVSAEGGPSDTPTVVLSFNVC